MQRNLPKVCLRLAKIPWPAQLRASTASNRFLTQFFFLSQHPSKRAHLRNLRAFFEPPPSNSPPKKMWKMCGPIDWVTDLSLLHHSFKGKQPLQKTFRLWSSWVSLSFQPQQRKTAKCHGFFSASKNAIGIVAFNASSGPGGLGWSIATLRGWSVDLARCPWRLPPNAAPAGQRQPGGSPKRCSERGGHWPKQN